MQGLKFWWIEGVIKYCMTLVHNAFVVLLLCWVVCAA